MQEPFGRPTRLAGRLDRLGVCCAVFFLSTGWFYLLWRRVAPALSAGAALSLLIVLTVRMGARKSLQAREQALRRRLGGEMAVDSLLLQTPASAVSNAAAWLSHALEEPLGTPEPKGRGLLARCGEETVWVACIQKHPSGRAGADDVLGVIRDARREKAQTCVICATCGFSPEAVSVCEDASPRTRLLGRPTLCALAGAVAPADDEQLRALGRRRRKKFRSELWRARITDPAKAGRYAAYGLGLLGLYLALGKLVYLVPAGVCLALFVLCRRKPGKKFRL